MLTHSVTLECLAQSKRAFYGATGRSTPKDRFYSSSMKPHICTSQTRCIVSCVFWIHRSHHSWPKCGTPSTSNFLALMLGTHSRPLTLPLITHSRLNDIFTGERYIPSAFLSLEWDTGLHYSNAESSLDGSSRIENLVQWGRPPWSAIYDGQRPPAVQALESDKMDKTDLRRCVWYAAKNFLPAE